MLETNSIIEQINTSDRDIDTDNFIDEKKVIQNIISSQQNFDDFQKNQLQNLQSQLSVEEFEKLHNDFTTLKQNFQIELDVAENKLEQLKQNQLEEYAEIIWEMQDKFWGALKIQPWDTLWDVAVKYLWLPATGKLENYSWFDLVDTIQSEQKISHDSLQVWDIMIIPAEYTILKDIMQHGNKIDIVELLKNNEIIYRTEYNSVSETDKFNTDLVLLKYFQTKWNTQKVDILFEKIFTYTRPKKNNIVLPSISKEEKNDGLFDTLIAENQDKWNYEGISWFFEWITDGFQFWVFSQLKSYADFLDGDTFKKVSEWIEKLVEDPIPMLKELYGNLKEEFGDIDFSAPHALWKTTGKLVVNILIAFITGWVFWASIKLTSKLTQLSKLTTGLKKAKEFTKQMTGWIELKKINILKNPSWWSFKQLWIEALYHSGSWIIMTGLDVKKISRALKWVKWFNADWLKVMKHKWEDVLLVDAIAIPGMLTTRLRRYTSDDIKMNPTIWALKQLLQLFSVK